jgi:hypothetical protein
MKTIIKDLEEVLYFEEKINDNIFLTNKLKSVITKLKDYEFNSKSRTGKEV